MKTLSIEPLTGFLSAVVSCAVERLCSQFAEDGDLRHAISCVRLAQAVACCWPRRWTHINAARRPDPAKTSKHQQCDRLQPTHKPRWKLDGSAVVGHVDDRNIHIHRLFRPWLAFGWQLLCGGFLSHRLTRRSEGRKRFAARCSAVPGQRQSPQRLSDAQPQSPGPATLSGLRCPP